MEYNEFIKYLESFYSGTSLPRNVHEYALNYPKGYGRTAIKTKFGVPLSKVLTDINAEYTKTNDVSVSISNLNDMCAKSNIKWVNPTSYINTKLPNLEFECAACTDTFVTSYASFTISKHKCPNCAKNKPLEIDVVKENIYAIAKENNCTVANFGSLEEATKVNRTAIGNTFININCNTCGSTFEKGLTTLYYRRKCRCPTCFPSKVYPEYYNNIQFNSKFEKECYILLAEVFADLVVHKPYKELIQTLTKRYSADFYIPSKNLIIEVTAYSSTSEFFKRHSDTLKIKEELAASNNINFLVFRSLPELEKFIRSLKI